MIVGQNERMALVVPVFVANDVYCEICLAAVINYSLLMSLL